MAIPSGLAGWTPRIGSRILVRGAVLACFLAGLLSPALVQADEEEETPTHVKALAAARAVTKSFVRVELALRYDKGEAPAALGDSPPFAVGSDRPARLISEKRPYLLSGLLLAPDRVLTGDPEFNARFVQGWRVLFGEQSTEARPVAWLEHHRGIILQLDSPLAGAVPLEFAAQAQGPYYGVQYVMRNARWELNTGKAFGVATLSGTPPPILWSWPSALIVAEDGRPVGVTLGAAVPDDDAWRGSPLAWPAYDRAAVEEIHARQERVTRGALLNVHLSLRSPREEASGEGMFSSLVERSHDEGDTERDVCGVLLGDRRLLVVAELEAQVTARLERIQVRPENHGPVAAKFRYSLKDYGAFLAELEEPLEGSIELSGRDLHALLRELLLDCHLTIQGEQRVSYLNHTRITDVSLSWERQVVPTFHDAKGHYLFDTQGRLVALPLIRRKQDADRSPYRSRDSEVFIPVAYLRPVLEDPEAHSDPSNVPLSEEEENRIAWLGVELQALNADLARANQVSHLTNDGRIGAIVSYVYPDSPAERGGIEAGAILIRIHAPDRPKPIPIKVARSPFSGFGELFGQMGEEAERWFDRMPGLTPWPSVDNELNRQITSIGFGKDYAVELVQDGEQRRTSFKVVEGPPHYKSAAHLKHEELGLSVRDVTYEVRRYLQLEDDAPGVIVSKVEPGSRAAVAGIRRFELIATVNDAPVEDVRSFAAALKKGGELRLKVRRRDKERIVKVSL